MPLRGLQKITNCLPGRQKRGHYERYEKFETCRADSGAVSCCVFSGGMTSSAKTAVSEEKTVYKPSVLTEVTAKSRKVQVYVYENTTLYVKAGNKRIYKKSFSSEGVKRITIPAQKKGTTLSFWLVNENNGKKGAVVKTRVLAKKYLRPGGGSKSNPGRTGPSD